MYKLWMVSGALLGMIGVMLGAFGAHALKSFLEAQQRLDTFETAVKYQFYHALALVLVGYLAKEFPQKTWVWGGNALLAGVLIFSGALYLICFTGIKAFGAVAPIGGTLLVIGWGLIAWTFTRAL